METKLYRIHLKNEHFGFSNFSYVPFFTGKYSPEKFPIPHNKRAPNYSFGGRFADLKEDKSPAPNNYALPSLFDGKHVQGPSAPSYSICGRPKIGAYYEDLQKVSFFLFYFIFECTHLRQGFLSKRFHKNISFHLYS